MPYVSIKTFPQDDAAKKRAAEKIQALLVELWGCEPDWISVSVENIVPEEWDERVVRGMIEPDRAHLLIRDGQKLYDA